MIPMRTSSRSFNIFHWLAEHVPKRFVSNKKSTLDNKRNPTMPLLIETSKIIQALLARSRFSNMAPEELTSLLHKDPFKLKTTSRSCQDVLHIIGIVANVSMVEHLFP